MDPDRAGPGGGERRAGHARRAAVGTAAGDRGGGPRGPGCGVRRIGLVAVGAGGAGHAHRWAAPVAVDRGGPVDGRLPRGRVAGVVAAVLTGCVPAGAMRVARTSE